MDRKKIEELQNSQLSILKYVDSICDVLKIKYYAVFGTLLGAVRHNGCIPWDADIDIAMFRSDYELFKSYSIAHNNERYFYQDYSTEDNHIAPHAIMKDKKTHLLFYNKGINTKYDGVYIDIFPIDNVPEMKLRRNILSKKLYICRRIIYYKQAKIFGNTTFCKQLAKKTLSIILKPFSYKSLGQRIEKIQKAYDNKATNLCAICSSRSGYRQFVDKEIYGNPKRYDYNGFSISIPNDSDTLLKKWYGNYMSLPPESERWKLFDDVIEDVLFD